MPYSLASRSRGGQLSAKAPERRNQLSSNGTIAKKYSESPSAILSGVFSKLIGVDRLTLSVIHNILSFMPKSVMVTDFGFVALFETFR